MRECFTITAVLLAALVGLSCEPDGIAVQLDANDTAVEDPEPCPELAANRCSSAGCEVEGDRVVCSIAWHLPEGHVGELALVPPGSGEIEWGVEPWLADPGPWAGRVEGLGDSCGLVSFELSSVPRPSTSTLVCVDSTAGLFDLVELDVD